MLNYRTVFQNSPICEVENTRTFAAVIEKTNITNQYLLEHHHVYDLRRRSGTRSNQLYLPLISSSNLLGCPALAALAAAKCHGVSVLLHHSLPFFYMLRVV